MCKIIIIPDASKIQNFDVFSRFCADILSDMRDGYGFIAQGQKGLFGHRTTMPLSYAHGMDIPDFCESPGLDFGVKSLVTGAAMFHGRTSTNSVSLLNTHPITRDDWHLIHNGVVTHHGEKYSMLTSNDSEHVLYNLINGGIDGAAYNLTGYYAAGAIDPEGQLHVFRDAIAQLYYAYSKKLKTGIFATTIELIDEIGDFIKENLVAAKVKDNTYLIYKNGEVIESRTFISRGYDSHSAGLAGRSLGRELLDHAGAELSNLEGFANEIPVYLEELDDTYTYHYGFKEISYEDFISLSYYDQADCEVRKNGVIIDWVLEDIA